MIRLLEGLIVLTMAYMCYTSFVGFKEDGKRRRKGAALEYDCVNIARQLGGFEVFQNVCLRYNGRSYVEADVVLVSKRFIYVIECKNYGGVVKGEAHERNWTCEYPYSKKHKFYNPILQNETHVDVLSRLSGIDKKCIRNMVIFGKNSDIWNLENCHGVFRLGDLGKVLSKLERDRRAGMTEHERIKVLGLLKGSVYVTRADKKRHINEIKTKYRTGNKK